ncbi:MAG: ABC transporter substrate-binding protein [Halanaerobium sp.]
MRKYLVLGLVLFLTLTIVGTAAAETEVRISGFGGNDQSIVEELLARFVEPELEGEIEVVYEPVADNFQQVLLNSLSAGTGADLFYMDIFWAQSLIDNDLVEPLNDYLEDSDVLKRDDIVDNLIDGFTYDDKVYGIPKDFNSLAVFYNKDLFDIADVEYPSDDDTWTEFEEKISTVAEFSDDFEGLAISPSFERLGAFTYGTGWQNFDDQGKTDLMDERFVESFEWYTDLEKEGYAILPGDIGADWAGGALAEGNVAAAIEGAWLIGALRDQAPNLNYGTAKLPKNPETEERGNFIYTVAWGMNAESEVKDEAFKVMELLTSPEAQQWVLERGLAIPSRKELEDNEYFEQDSKEAQANLKVFESASDGNVYPYEFDKYGSDWMDPINTALNEVMSDEMSVEEALEEAQERLDKDVLN